MSVLGVAKFMGKEKVLSVRLREDQLAKLDDLSSTHDTTKSKFVRKLVNTHLKAHETGKKVYHMKISPSQYKTIEQQAQKINMKPEKFLRKLLKSSLEGEKSGGSISSRGVNKEKYDELVTDHEGLSNLYEDLSKKYKKILQDKKHLENNISEMEGTIETLSQLKDDYLKQLLFLMKFFQKNGEILQEHDRKFLVDNKEQFAMIAKQLEGMA